jgi:NADH-quinone oxidoreductase subunit H
MNQMFNLIDIIINSIMWIVMLLCMVAFFTLGERKLMAAVQRRKGPDIVGWWGTLQAFADGVKAMVKEIIFPSKSNSLLFIASPIFVFVLSLVSWGIVPISEFSWITSFDLAVFLTLIFGSLSVYGIIMAGWSTNSRYPFLGGVRATAQMISYELILGTINLIIALMAGSFNYVDIVYAQKQIWFLIPLFPIFIIYLICMLAETNRTPFDLTEAEAELVAGYNVEYSSIIFAMFFLGEYANMLLLAVVCSLYFLGGWVFFGGFTSVFFFILKVLFICVFFIWVRATLPRIRYDQLMAFGWKHLLPFLFGFLIFLISFLLIFEIRLQSYDFFLAPQLLNIYTLIGVYGNTFFNNENDFRLLLNLSNISFFDSISVGSVESILDRNYEKEVEMHINELYTEFMSDILEVLSVDYSLTAEQLEDLNSYILEADLEDSIATYLG